MKCLNTKIGRLYAFLFENGKCDIEDLESLGCIVVDVMNNFQFKISNGIVLFSEDFIESLRNDVKSYAFATFELG